MNSGDIKRIFIILVDISGYTRFIRLHKISLLHAEKIVDLLMESILEQVKQPVIAHEILGDAISLYAVDESKSGQADEIYTQLENYFDAFRVREARLISECNICACEACKNVGKLKLKAILHAGHAAFTTVHGKRKISGEDVIISHRLLKNSVPSNEYILMTEAFYQKCTDLDISNLTRHSEDCAGIGQVDIMVQNFENTEVVPVDLPLLQRIKGLLLVEGYMFKRFIVPRKLAYRNLPE